MIIDTHAHYDDDRFIPDRDRILGQDLPAGGIGMVINVAADEGSVDTTYELSRKYDHVYAALGIHPSELSNLSEGILDHIRELAKDRENVRAIGEIGFDYHGESYDKEEQEKWFIKQLDLADELNLPVVIHSRGAAADTMRVIEERFGGSKGGINGVIHCFSYALQDAVRYTELGFMIGVGGVVTFKNGKKLKEVVEKIPLDRIVLETDAPYLAPDPHRGERNCSLYLKYVVDEISRIKGISTEETEEITSTNAKRLYRFL